VSDRFFGGRLIHASGLRWKAHFGIARVRSFLRDIEKWTLRRPRYYQWKQWGMAGYRELRNRGVTVREA